MLIGSTSTLRIYHRSSIDNRETVHETSFNFKIFVCRTFIINHQFPITSGNNYLLISYLFSRKIEIVLEDWYFASMQITWSREIPLPFIKMSIWSGKEISLSIPFPFDDRTNFFFPYSIKWSWWNCLRACRNL